MTPRRHALRIAAVAAVLGIALALVPTAAYAVSLPTGNLTGTITDANGAPVVGASVYIDAASHAGTAMTNASGQYTITGVPAGSYYFSINDYPAHVRYPQFSEPPVVVDVPVSGTATQNAVLSLFSTVSGVVTGSAVPLDEVIVYLEGVTVDYGVSNSPSGTAPDGVYSFTNLPPGQYLLHFQPPAGSDLATEVYLNERKVSDATLITLAPGGTSFVANADLESSTVQIAGSVTTGGPAFTSVAITLYDVDQKFLAFTFGDVAAGTYSTAGILPNTGPAAYYVKAEGYDSTGNFYRSPIQPVSLAGSDVTQNLIAALVPPVSPAVINPVADSYPVDQDTVLSRAAAAGVIANDTSTPAGALFAALDDPPDHGDLFLAYDGSFRYAPDDGFVGTDTFVYLSGTRPGIGTLATVTLTVRAVLPPTGLEVSPVLLALAFTAFGVGAVLVVVAVRRRSA